MKPLLLVEDEPVLRREISAFLRDAGWQVSEAATLAECDRQLDSQPPSIIILDLGLPDGDGIDLIARLRQRSLPLGIIVLTARTSVADKLKGLNIGADHYLPKSVGLDELAVTVTALARRLDLGGVNPDWVLVASGRKLVPPGHAAIDLSPQDYAVLHALMQAAGNIVSRRTLVEVMGDDFLTSDPARLDTQMRRLRKKLQDSASLELPVKTLRNEGYQFFAPAQLRE
jgi:DNA-binding response OmpR family regulator